MQGFGGLQLGSILIHQISKVAVNGEKVFQAELTDIPVVLDPKDAGYLTDRFREALLKRASQVVEVATASPVPGFLRDYWWNGLDLAPASQAIAEHLVEAQPMSARPGVLVVGEAAIGTADYILIAKVEHQSAMRAAPERDKDGQRFIQIERISDLVFGDQTRIYKIALIPKPGQPTDELQADLADAQNGNRLAAYFLGDFLGMKMADEPDVLTERFLTNLSRAINDSGLAPEDKVDAQSALAAEVRSNAQTIDPLAFIRNHVPTSHQSDIKRMAAERNVPLVPFGKDVQRVKSRLERLKMQLGEDIYIVAPADSIGSGRQIEVASVNGSTSADGEVVVKIARAKLGNITNNGAR